MATDPPFSAPGPPNGGPAPGGLSPLRAGLVLIVFVVGIITLVSVGTRPSLGSKAFATVTTTTSASHHQAAGTTTTLARSAVTVLVANATSANGLAGHYTTVLAAQGWSMKPATDAATTVSASVVYYAAGEQAAAAAIATSLGLQPSAVQPLTAQVPVSNASGIDVVVLVGANLVTGT